MTTDIGPGTAPGPLMCDDGCGREAAVAVLSLADREADYCCWPCLIGRCVQIVGQMDPETATADAGDSQGRS